MTQSGQGDEQQLPAVRPAHEGVVLPSDGGAPWSPGGQSAEQAAPAGGQPWGQPWGPPAAQPLPDPQGPGQGQGQYEPQQGQYAPQQGPYPSPQDQYQQQDQYPPPQDPYQQSQGQYQQPYQGQQQPYAQPLPPEAVPGMGMGAGGDADATQFIAPVPAGPGSPGDADATQFIPPVPGGAPYGIRPGPPGDPGERQPPAEFDNLFRSEGPAGATQQMPQFDAGQQQPPHQQPPHQQPYQGRQGGQHGQQPPPATEPYQSGLQGLQGGYEPAEQQSHGSPRRRSSHIPLIAAVVVGCAVIGLGAGALMSGGDESGPDDKQPVAAQSSPVSEATTKTAADPAQAQAKELDKLLADSNNSRSAVISAVEKIKNCQSLDQAATDLKGAAQQRRELVTRLGGISVDQLPDHAALTSSLTKAWQASAKADDHYAAWAGQAKDKKKKVCKGGHARSTNETVRATEASAEASAAKRQASGIWNSIAEKYALTKRAPTQL